MTKILILFLTSLVLLVTSCSRLPTNDSLTLVSERLITESVPVIHTHELAANITKFDILLLDAREKNEFQVSHLPNSRWVGYETFNIESVSDLPSDTPITVYCSVGYRSEKIGERLQEAGFTNVTNLFGGIFMWANQDRPLSDPTGQATKVVHGYNQRWSKHLAHKITVYLD